MKKTIWMVIILTIIISTTGCGKTKKQKTLEEKREFMDLSYYNFNEEDDSIIASKYEDFIKDNQGEFIRWTIPVAKTPSSNELHLMEKNLPNVKVSFKYKVIETDNVEIGDVITFSGNIKKYIPGVFGTTPVWVVENARLEETSEADKKIVLNYQESLKKIQEDAEVRQKVDEQVSNNEEVSKIEEDTKKRVIEIAKGLEVGNGGIDMVTGMVVTRKKDGVYIGDKFIVGNDKLEESNEDNNIIRGLNSGGIKINLKNDYNLKFTGPNGYSGSNENKGYFNNGEFMTEQTTYLTEIYARGPEEIFYVIFTIIGNDLSDAGNYLGYCATVHYENSEPEKAKEWVQTNYKNLEGGSEIEKVFGGVRYELNRGPLGYSLMIIPEGVE